MIVDNGELIWSELACLLINNERMSIYLKKRIEEKGQVGIWRIEEEEHFFTQGLSISNTDKQLIQRKHSKTRLEWLAGRFLLHEMSNGKTCQVDEYGKPFLINSPLKVSISHSGEFAAVVVDKATVGIDIQKITPRIRRIAHKFLRSEEQACLDEPCFLEHLHVFWGAKEALYKAYGKKKLDFREHIFVEPFIYKTRGGSATGQVSKGNYAQKFHIQYEKINNYILVYVVQL